MKKTITTMLAVLCCCIASAQTGKDSYNSVCFFVGGSMETSLASQFGSLSHCATDGGYGWSHAAANGSAEGVVSKGDSLVFYNPYTDHIIRIDKMVSPWGGAYATPMGYFVYSDSLPYRIEGVDEGRMLSFVSFDKQTTANVVYNATNEKPICLVVNTTTIRLAYSSDECTIFSLGEEGKTLTKIGTKAMTSSAMTDYIAANNADNHLAKSVCRLLAAVESSALQYPSEVSGFIEQAKSLLVLTCNGYEAESDYYLPNDGTSFAFINDMATVSKVVEVINSGNESYTEEEHHWGTVTD